MQPVHLGTLITDPLGCLVCLFLQDIGESEASELVGLYRPLVGKAVQELLGDVDLSSQGSLEGLDLRDMVRPHTAGALKSSAVHVLHAVQLLAQLRVTNGSKFGLV
jgi:hypothetical protein